MTERGAAGARERLENEETRQRGCAVRQRRARAEDARQEEERAEGFVAALAGAAPERPLRAPVEGRGLALAGSLQADRDRRQAQAAQAWHAGGGPRCGSRRLAAGRGAAHQVPR